MAAVYHGKAVGAAPVDMEGLAASHIDIVLNGLLAGVRG